MFSIYLIEREDGLKYVGQTVDIRKRLHSHSTSKRFEKFKIKSFDVIDTASTKEEAYDKEKLWIKYYDTFNNGLNMTDTGGYGHKGHSLKFSTTGISYTKNTKWYNNGHTNIRAFEGDQPGGFELGRIKHQWTYNHTEEYKKKKSVDSKGKVFSRKISEEIIRELLSAYKLRPALDNVGERVGITKSMVLSYERAFSNFYAEKFGISANRIFGILKTNGGLAWKEIWKEILGDEKIDVLINKTTRRNLSEEEIRKIFTFINEEMKLGAKFKKDIIISAAYNFATEATYLSKLYNTKGGKKWKHVWEETIGSNDGYKPCAKISETQVILFYEGFLNSDMTKREFYKISRLYGLSEDKGRKLLYRKNKGKWQYIWDFLNNGN